MLDVASELPLSLLASHAGYEPATRVISDSDSLTAIVLALKQGGASIAGTVLDAEGGPIAGAELRASGLGDQVLALGVSDGAGRFRMDVASGATRIRARADGYTEELRTVRAPQLGLEISLAAAGSIVGHTIAEDTLSPVAGVLVTAASADGLKYVQRAELSGKDGTFRLDGLRPGRYSVQAVSESWRSDEGAVLLGLAQVTEPVELTLHRATQLSGVVRLGGVPCAQGSVMLEGPVHCYAPLGPGGSVTFDGVTPGRYQVSVACEGARQREALDIGTERVSRLWNLEAGLRMIGAALTARGLPIAGALINVEPLGPPEARGDSHCSTDARGEFSCGGLAPGDYDVRLGSGMPARTDPAHVHLASESSPPIVLRAHPEGAIRVRIDSAQRLDPSTLSVRARGPTPQPLFGETWEDTVVFDPVPLGGYDIFNESDPAGHAEHVELTRDGEVAEITLAQPTPHTLHGHVIDDQGQGVADAWVDASGERGLAPAFHTQPVLTEKDGTFSISGLTPGRYTLRVDWGRGEGHASGVPSDSSDVVVRVQAFGSLSGTLRSAAGTSVDHFVVSYSRDGADSRGDVSGAQGTWSLPWAAPGTYQLTAQTREGTTLRTVQLPPGGDVTVALQIERPAVAVEPTATADRPN